MNNMILGEYIIKPDPQDSKKQVAYIKPYNRPGEIPLSETQYFSGTFKPGQRVCAVNYNGEWYIISAEVS